MVIGRSLKVVWGVLVLILIGLQCRLWAGEGSYAQVWGLDAQIATQQTENGRLRERNRALAAEVLELRGAGTALEERARSQLGMVHPDETFYLFVTPDPSTLR